jgi:16S rRNA processing protein RimM
LNTDHLIIGRILRPFGLKGEMRLLPITDDIERFRNVKEICLKERGGFREVEVEASRITDCRVIIKLKGFDSRTAAELLRQKFIYVTRKKAVKLEKGSFYFFDILNCTVKDLNGRIIGRVFDIQNAGSCDVYAVRSFNGNQEYNIPAVEDVIKNIDIGRKEITIDMIDGLI